MTRKHLEPLATESLKPGQPPKPHAEKMTGDRNVMGGLDGRTYVLDKPTPTYDATPITIEGKPVDWIPPWVGDIVSHSATKSTGHRQPNG